MMRVAITNPTTWPYVRRGVERFINELARYLASQGVEATIVTGKPGPTARQETDGYRTVSYRRLWHPSFAKLGWHEYHSFFFTSLYGLMRNDFDVIQCCTFMDTFAALQTRRWTGTPCAFFVNGMPPQKRYYRTLTTGGAILGRSVRGADELITISRYMQQTFEDRFGRGGVVLPPPVDVERFPLNEHRDADRPVVFCAAALDDLRKGGAILFRAFDRLKDHRPSAVLRISCRLSDEKAQELRSLVRPRWHADIEFLGAGRVEDLPRLYGEASISVLPSIWEAFGLVAVESLATGTPVVATNDGALPEVISSPEIGRLFEPGPIDNAQATNVQGLTQAMIEAIELSQSPETPANCRRRAEEFSWANQGPRYLQLYEELANNRRSLTPKGTSPSCASS